jgi:hypothetical protein
MFRRAMPILQVRDVAASAVFYERLGFRHHGFWGDPPGFCIVQRGTVTLGLNRQGAPGVAAQNQWWVAYLYVDDVDGLHREFSALSDLPGLTEPGDREYGCRDFDAIDLDGHRLAFGQDLTDLDAPGLEDTRLKDTGLEDTGLDKIASDETE